MGLIRNVLEASAGAQETSALFLSLLDASSLLSPAGDVSVIICRADELQMLDYHHSIIDFKGHVSVSELITSRFILIFLTLPLTLCLLFLWYMIFLHSCLQFC
jgi:hypothetical protein